METTMDNEKETPVRARKRTQRERDRNKEYQKEYYLAHKEEILAKRREKYEQDDEYRKESRTRAARRYWFEERQKRKRGVPDTELASLEPLGVVSLTITNPKDARCGLTIKVPVYSTNHLSEILGRTAPTLRNWLKDGILPEPFLKAGDVAETVARSKETRLFTRDEMEIFSDERDKLLLPNHGRKHELFTQAVQERFDKELVNGIRPVLK